MGIAEKLRSLLGQDPFYPLVIRQKSGREFFVSLPDQLHLWPGGRRFQLLNGRADADSYAQEVEVASVEEVIAVDAKEATGPMTIEKFDEFMKRRPFEPFTVCVAEGSKIEVIGPEFASWTQSGRTIFVSTGGERTECIDLLLVTRLITGVENKNAQKTDAA